MPFQKSATSVTLICSWFVLDALESRFSSRKEAPDPQAQKLQANLERLWATFQLLSIRLTFLLQKPSKRYFWQKVDFKACLFKNLLQVSHSFARGLFWML